MKKHDLILENWIPENKYLNDVGIPVTKSIQLLEYNRAANLLKDFEYQGCLGIFSNEFLFKQSQNWFVDHPDPSLYLKKSYFCMKQGLIRKG